MSHARMTVTSYSIQLLLMLLIASAAVMDHFFSLELLCVLQHVHAHLQKKVANVCTGMHRPTRPVMHSEPSFHHGGLCLGSSIPQA